MRGTMVGLVWHGPNRAAPEEAEWAMVAVRVMSQTVLAPGPDAPRAAREFAAGVLRQWRLEDALAAVELIVSELVTNAVCHAGTTVTVRLARVPEGLLIEVDDTGGGDPRVVAARKGALGGHGLAIVERLADAWGHESRAGGKTVWARLAVKD